MDMSSLPVQIIMWSFAISFALIVVYGVWTVGFQIAEDIRKWLHTK